MYKDNVVHEDAEVTGANTHKGIQDLARELGVTARTLRFYEDKGLISPLRVGSTRIYTKRDVVRMQLILRGKKLGFTIREIREFLDLYDIGHGQREQLEHLLSRVRERLGGLEKQKAAIDETIAELHKIEAEALERLEGKAA